MQNVINDNSSQTGMRKIPLISLERMRYVSGLSEPFQFEEGSNSITSDLELGPRAFALELQGEELPSSFKQGDLVIVDPAVSPLMGDFVIAKLGNKTIVFRQFKQTDRLDSKGCLIIELVQSSTDEAPINSEVDSILIIGTMIEYRRYKKFKAV